MKSTKNKTINLTPDESAQYLKRCVQIGSAAKLCDVIDKTVFGNALEVMTLLPEKSVDLMIADPPYNLDKQFDGNKFRKTSDEDYLQYTEKWLEAAMPLLKDNATVYVCCDWKSGVAVYSALKKYMTVRNRITWQREKGRGALHNWKNGMEDIWYATKSDNFTFNAESVKIRRKVIAPYRVNGNPKDWEETDRGNFRNTFASNFWDDISIPYWSMPENTPHPTQKPEKLAAKLILASSNPGDVIFDPFLGSGTTSVTAKKLKRHFIGIEQSANYCALAEKRLDAADSCPQIQGYCDGVFWERNTAALQKNNDDDF